MYYKGTPLVETNLIDKAELGNYPSYFALRAEHCACAERVFEHHKAGGEIDLIVYYNAKWNDTGLTQHHQQHYAGIAYDVQEVLAPRTIKTTMVAEGADTTHLICHYRQDWSKITEQWYDESFKLVEYRTFIYGDDEVTVVGEHVFYTSTWEIDKVIY